MRGDVLAIYICINVALTYLGLLILRASSSFGAFFVLSLSRHSPLASFSFPFLLLYLFFFIYKGGEKKAREGKRYLNVFCVSVK